MFVYDPSSILVSRYYSLQQLGQTNIFSDRLIMQREHRAQSARSIRRPKRRHVKCRVNCCPYGRATLANIAPSDLAHSVKPSRARCDKKTVIILHGKDTQ
jgi:hypothetical protein